eukprot:gene33398-41213_t
MIYLLKKNEFDRATRRTFNQYIVLYEIILRELNANHPDAFNAIADEKLAGQLIRSEEDNCLVVKPVLSCAEQASKYHIIEGKLTFPWTSLDTLRSCLLETAPSSKAKGKYISIVHALTNHETIQEFVQSNIRGVNIKPGSVPRVKGRKTNKTTFSKPTALNLLTSAADYLIGHPAESVSSDDLCSSGSGSGADNSSTSGSNSAVEHHFAHLHCESISPSSSSPSSESFDTSFDTTSTKTSVAEHSDNCDTSSANTDSRKRERCEGHEGDKLHQKYMRRMEREETDRQRSSSLGGITSGEDSCGSSSVSCGSSSGSCSGGSAASSTQNSPTHAQQMALQTQIAAAQAHAHSVIQRFANPASLHSVTLEHQVQHPHFVITSSVVVFTDTEMTFAEVSEGRNGA